jgi:hypothetical protein
MVFLTKDSAQSAIGAGIVCSLDADVNTGRWINFAISMAQGDRKAASIWIFVQKTDHPEM